MPLSHVTLFLPWALVVLTAADPLCDPDTQYLLNGECCQKCKPGTFMAPTGNCRSPECRDCPDNEYTDKYNRESMCKQQPYCDPNSNFEFRVSSSKTQRHTCLCKPGFHCSSVSCVICAPHTECEPGYGAKVTGGQNQDTVCEKCPEGQFSEEKSWNATCKTPEPRGADQDSGLKREHIGLICAGVIIPLLVAGAIWFFKCKGKTGHEPLKIVPPDDALYNIDDYKLTVEEMEKEKKSPIIASPTDDREDSYQTPFCRSLPEESEYRTENGHCVSQDFKEHVTSQPETNEQTTTRPM